MSKRSRIEIASYILQLLSYAHPKNPHAWLQIGIDNLVEIGAFSDHFPLNDCLLALKNSRNEKGNISSATDPEVGTSGVEEVGRKCIGGAHERCKYTRSFLAMHWASIRCLFKQQPIDHVREYFGEELAFYFHWLGVNL